VEIRDPKTIVADEHEQELIRLLAELKRIDAEAVEIVRKNESGQEYLTEVSEAAKRKAEDEKRSALSLALTQKRAREKATSAEYEKRSKDIVDKKNQDEISIKTKFEAKRQDETSRCAHKATVLQKALADYTLKEKEEKQRLISLLTAEEVKSDQERELAEEVHVKNSASRASRQASDREALTVEFGKAYDTLEKQQLKIYREGLTSLKSEILTLKAKEEGRRASITRDIENRVVSDESDLNAIYALLNEGKVKFQEIENFAKRFGGTRQLQNPTSVAITSMREARNQFELLHNSLAKGRDKLPSLIAEHDAEFTKVTLYAVGWALGILVVGLIVAWLLGAFS
jgi:hypothetical protein